MYAVALVRYRRPLDEVLKHVEAHRVYLRDLKERGRNRSTVSEGGDGSRRRDPDRDQGEVCRRARRSPR